MNRLPSSAALLLLFAVVWFCMKSPKGGGQIDQTGAPAENGSIQSAEPSISGPARSSPSEEISAKSSLFPRVTSGIPITAEFVRNLAMGPENISLRLPDGRQVNASVEQRQTAADGSNVGVSGRLESPNKGTFHFRIQPSDSPTGPVIGAIVIEGAEIAFRVLPGPGQTSLLAAQPIDQVICRNYILPPQYVLDPQEIPADHPTDLAIPSYQNGIPSLQSRPGAEGVIYLDFDGEKGPHEGWGDFDAAAPSGMTPDKVMNIWTRVSEDFAPFNLNITTDLQVFLRAPETSRQRCIITPTRTASPNAGGVAFMGSFNWSGDTPAWCFYTSSSKFAAEIISHEIGHTLGLSHDGRINAESYYLGHSSDLVGWAPIMGAGYYKNLTQWSKGEYNSANQLQDDLAIIAANPGVGLVDDEAGDTQATAAPLEVYTNGSIQSQGNIATPSDIDAFSFTTTGGPVALTISPVPNGQNLDIIAGIYDATGNPIISDNPDLRLDATLAVTLAAGVYTVRVDGTGRGNPGTDGYSNYGSLGQYTITGTIAGAIIPDRFTIAENDPVETIVGKPTLRNNHASSPLTYEIAKGNVNSAFKIHRQTGVITVANRSAIDFETLSKGWNDPAEFDLTIEVKDKIVPSLNESLRVVVSVQDFKELVAEITLSNLTQSYDGTPKSVTVITSPPGLSHSLTYSSSPTSPAAIGDYTVKATITDPNYTGTSSQIFKITSLLSVASAQTFTTPQSSILFQGLTNDGTIVVTTPLNVSGNATNNGVLRLCGDSTLNITGTFTNNGVIDIINWNGTLPTSMINAGKILDRSAIRVVASSTTSTQFRLSVPGFKGHLYQLESSTDLTNSSWTSQGDPVLGTGDAENPPILQFAPNLSGPKKFYRVAVTPAP